MDKEHEEQRIQLWLNKQVRDENGALLLDRLYAIAKKYGIEKRYDNLNPGQQRMNIGVQLRKLVEPKEYASVS